MTEKLPLSALLLGLLLQLAAFWPNAYALDSGWTTVNPLPADRHFEDVLWNPDLNEFIAVGNGGIVATSPDGSTWTAHYPATIQKLYSVLWDGTQYWITGEGGLLLAGPNADNLSARASGTRRALFDLAFKGTTYVAVGQIGTVIASTDSGATWTALNPNTGAALLAVATNGLQIVAVGSSGTVVTTSDDGASWSKATLEDAAGRSVTVAEALQDVIWNAARNEFIAVGSSGRVAVSPAGAQVGYVWTIGSANTTVGLYGVAWGGGQYIAAGWQGVVTTSPDAVNWTPQSSGATTQIEAIAWDGVSYTAVGDGVILASLDGANWSAATSDIAGGNVLQAVAWGGGRFVAAGAAGTVLWSTDGNRWTKCSVCPAVQMNAVAYDSVSLRHIAVGAGGAIRTSSNGGVTWTSAFSTGTLADLHGVTSKGPGIPFVAVGDNGTIVASWNNGANWQAAASGPPPEHLRAVAANGTTYVAVGDAGVILTSTDGDAWTPATNPQLVRQALYGITWDATLGLFVAVGAGGTVLTSGDGASWTEQSSGSSATLRAVAANATQIFVVGDAGATAVTIRTARAGTSWRTQLAGRVQDLNGVAWNGTQFVAVGAAGTVLASGGLDLAVNLDPPSDDVDGVLNVNDPGDYTLTVSNNGNLDATGVILTHTPPVNAVVDQLWTVFGTAICPATLPVAAFTCDLGAGGVIEAGSDGVSVLVGVTYTLDGTATSTAAVTVANGPDVNPANDQLVSSIAISPAVLVLQDPDNPDFGVAGGGTVGWWTLGALFLAGAAAGRRRARYDHAPMLPLGR